MAWYAMLIRRTFATPKPELEPKPIPMAMSMELGTVAATCVAPQLLFSSSPNVTKKSCISMKRRRRRSSSSTILKMTAALCVARGSLAPVATTGLVRPPISNPLMPGIEDLDTTNMLLRQRIVFLGSQVPRKYENGNLEGSRRAWKPEWKTVKVDDLNADFIVSQLLLLDAKDSTKKIQFFINSPGGSVIAGMGIHDAMKLCKADVSTICFGLAASMGAFLLAGGTKGKRLSMPNARIMIHQPWGGFDATFPDLQIRVREMLYHKVKLEKLMAHFTGKTQEQIATDTDHDKYMDPWDAREYGIIDIVIDEDKPGLIAPVPIPDRPSWDLNTEYVVYGERKERRPALSEDTFF